MKINKKTIILAVCFVLGLILLTNKGLKQGMKDGIESGINNKQTEEKNSEK